MVSTSNSPRGSLAPAVARAVGVLDFLARSQGRPQPLTSIARAIGAAKSSTSNVVSVLVETDMVRRHGDGYVLGRRTAELGGAYLAGFNEVDEFYRLCGESPALSRELAQLAVLDGTDVQYLARREGSTSMRLTARVGQRLPATLTAVGNAMLAHLPAESLDRILETVVLPEPMTERSITSVGELRRAIDATRERGYAIDDGGVFPHVFGVAVAVRGASEDAPFAIGVSMIGEGSALLGSPRLTAIIEALQAGSAQLAHRR